MEAFFDLLWTLDLILGTLFIVLPLLALCVFCWFKARQLQAELEIAVEAYLEEEETQQGEASCNSLLES